MDHRLSGAGAGPAMRGDGRRTTPEWGCPWYYCLEDPGSAAPRPACRLMQGLSRSRCGSGGIEVGSPRMQYPSPQRPGLGVHGCGPDL